MESLPLVSDEYTARSKEQQPSLIFLTSSCINRRLSLEAPQG